MRDMQGGETSDFGFAVIGIYNTAKKLTCCLVTAPAHCPSYFKVVLPVGPTESIKVQTPQALYVFEIAILR